MLANDPLLWLSVSTALLAVSATAVVIVAIPVVLKFSKTAQSAERLLETLNQELPATLDALRSTGEELSSLTEDLGDGVESAKSIVKRVDIGMGYAEQQWQQAQIISKSAIAGFRTAWTTLFPSNETHQSRPEPLDREPSAQGNLDVQSTQSALSESRAIAPSHSVDSGSLPPVRDSSADAEYADPRRSNSQNVSASGQAKPFSQQ